MALVLAVVVLVILAITFRGLWFVALPLGLIALVLAVRGGRSPAVVGYLGVLLALIAFTGAALAAVADISIDRGYDVYENSDPADQPAFAVEAHGQRREDRREHAGLGEHERRCRRRRRRRPSGRGRPSRGWRRG